MSDTTSIRARYSRTVYNAGPDGSEYCVINCITETTEGLPTEVISRNTRKGGKCEITITGYSLPEYDNVEVEYYGEWVSHKSYGPQFDARGGYSVIAPQNEYGMRIFLASGIIKGIGPKTASKIVDKFGAETFTVLSEEPERLLSIPRITKKKVALISASYRSVVHLSKLAAFLGSHNISVAITSAVYAKYEDSAIDVISSNPFALLNINGVGFTTADRMAKELGIMLNSHVRIIGCLKSIYQDATAKGNIYITRDIASVELYKRLNDGFNSEIVSREDISNAIDGAINDNEFVIRGGVRLFSASMDRCERNVAVKITQLLNSDKQESLSFQYINELENWQERNNNIVLSEKQREAIIGSLMSKISVITGGPGTGKTTILKAIMEIYQKLNKNKAVTLLAPTGRAARRMTESTEYPASTIHSALGLLSGDDLTQDNCGIILERGIIVVDEMSMVDIYVANALCNSIDVLYHQVVFIGDADQLPSVGPGNVLREIIRSSEVPVTTLDVIYRQSAKSTIISNAHKINTGDTNLEYDDTFQFISASDEEFAQKRIIDLYKVESAKHGVENVVILSPFRKRGNVCANMINREIQGVVNPQRVGDMSVTLSNYTVRQRDRVIQTRNTQVVSNGDIGIVKNIDTAIDGDGDKEPVITIEFENGVTVSYEKEEMKNVDLAYALSIHKSQGSQYDTVIIPLMTSHSIMLKRNLLYTAVTRAKKNVIIVGQKSAIRDCILTCDNDKRNTLLADRIHSYRNISRNKK